MRLPAPLAEIDRLHVPIGRSWSNIHPTRHPSKEVRQDLMVLPARDALVAARTGYMNRCARACPRR